MPLEILAPLVGIGITTIGILLHYTGNSARLVISDLAHAQRIWAASYPELPCESYLASDDKHQALVQTADGPGLIWAMGADAACRQFRQSVQVDRDARGFHLHSKDFTAPKIAIALKDLSQQQRWRDILKGTADG